MERASIDLEYLESAQFHIERILDYLTVNLPLSTIHQTRSLVVCFHVMAAMIAAVVVPRLASAGPRSIDPFVVFFPSMVSTAFHVIISICYGVLVLFTGSSLYTFLGIMFYMHTSVPFVVFGFLIHYFSTGVSDPVFTGVVWCAAGFASDFTIGLLSARSSWTILWLEGIAVIPSLILRALYETGSLKYAAVPFIPWFVFFGMYTAVLLGLWPKCTRARVIKFLSDREIAAEFTAARDFESYMNAALWRDSTKHREEAMRPDDDAPAQAGTRKRDFRFPRNESFQLYKVDGIPKHPFFVTSIPVIGSLFVLVCMCTVQSMVEVEVEKGFPIFCAGVMLVLCSLAVSSRAIVWSFLCVTNISREWIDIMWDHPSFALL